MGLLIEKDQEGYREEETLRRGARVSLRNLGGLWGSVVLPEDKIKDSGLRKLGHWEENDSFAAFGREMTED